MQKCVFLFGLLSTAISNIIAFQQPDATINEGEATNWMASSVLRHDGSTVYYAISDLPMAWDEAYEYCHNQMGYLAEPRSPEETEEINKLVDGRNAWIGLTDKVTEALFLWNSDGQNTQSYHNWGEGEPSGDGDCAHLYFWTDEKWNDLYCDHMTDQYGNPIYALCQKIV